MTQFLQSRGRMRGRPIKRTLRDQQAWAPAMEEGGRLSSTGPRRERVLPVQVDARRSTSKSDSRSASCRIGACVQRAQSNDRAWSTRVVRDRSVTNLRVGALGASFDLRNNAPIHQQLMTEAPDVEAQFSTVVTPALGAGHPVDRVHRSSVPGGNPRFSPKISEVKATDQQRPAQAPAYRRSRGPSPSLISRFGGNCGG